MSAIDPIVNSGKMGLAVFISFIAFGMIIMGIATSTALNMDGSSAVGDVMNPMVENLSAGDYNITNVTQYEGDGLFVNSICSNPGVNEACSSGKLIFQSFENVDGNIEELQVYMQFLNFVDDDNEFHGGLLLSGGPVNSEEKQLLAITPFIDENSNIESIQVLFPDMNSEQDTSIDISIGHDDIFSIYPDGITIAADVEYGDGYYIALFNGDTTSVTPTVLWSEEVDENRTLLIELDILSQETEGSDTGGYKIQGLFQRGPGADLNQIGTTSVISTFETDAGMDADFNIVGNDLQILGTGVATHMKWQINFKEISIR